MNRHIFNFVNLFQHAVLKAANLFLSKRTVGLILFSMFCVCKQLHNFVFKETPKRLCFILNKWPFIRLHGNFYVLIRVSAIACKLLFDLINKQTCVCLSALL